MVLVVETLSHTGAVQRRKMATAKRPDAVVNKLQQGADAWSESGRSVSGLHVPFSIHAPSATCSLERDQGAKEEGMGVRVRDIHDGARVGNSFADSFEVGGEGARVGWKLLAS